MSGDILATIARGLTPDQIAAFAAQAEIDAASARKAAELGVPTILGALGELAQPARGAARLGSALKQWPIGAGRPPQPAAQAPDAEDGLIAFLLGAESSDALASAIGRCVGATAGATQAFLDEVTATILSALAEECATRGDEAVADLLKVNRDLFASAMPAGLLNLLKGNAFFDRLGRSAASPSVHGGGQAGAPPAPLTPRLAGQSQARWAWLLGLLGLIAGAAWYLFTAVNEPIGRSGEGVRTTLSELWDHLVGRVAARAEMAASPARLGGDIYSEAGEKLGGLTHPASPDGQLPMAATSLGRHPGTGEDDLAVAIAQLPDRADLRAFAELASEEQRMMPRLPSSRHHLRFVSPECRDAIARALPVAINKPVVSLVAE